VHPALQVGLGDIFLDAATRQGRQFLIETHSEHLLLRLMRRMRETSEGTLPEGAARAAPSHVKVWFVEREGSGCLIRNIPLNERGDLVKAWPGGFFEEGLREVM
jgi:predicted ATPase